MEQFTFSYQNIDQCCEQAETFLQKAKVDKRENLRTKLMLEEILLHYRERFGEDAKYHFQCGKRFFSQRIEASVEGEAYDPIAEEDSEYEVIRGLLAGAGLAPTWSYKNGKNYIVFLPKKKPLSQTMKILYAVIAAIIAGVLMSFLPDAIMNGISSYLLSPVSDVFMGLLSAVAGPVIFLSILGSICSMGNLETLEKIGKRTIFTILGVSALTSVYACLVMVMFYPLQSGGSQGNDISGVMEMVYGIVPKNLFSPFTEGNVLQIIFVAVICGVAMLVLAGRVPQVSALIEQLNMIAQTIMEGVASLLYVLVFLLILNMIVGDTVASLLNTYKMLLFSLGLLAGFAILLVLGVSIHKRVSPALMIKKMLPTFLIAVTTASSAAALTTNVQDTQKKMGIDRKLAQFGVPLGQIIFKPGFIVMLTAVEFGLANTYEIPITVSWVVMACIVNFLMSTSVPPVPGGALACFTIIFAQLGIPVEALAVIFALDIITDFPNTATGCAGLQLILVEVADSLKMLDKEKLRKEI